ncbi:MAG: hypothetical protein AB7P76_04175 [Candidatus Melainabacteria bacterium]
MSMLRFADNNGIARSVRTSVFELPALADPGLLFEEGQALVLYRPKDRGVQSPEGLEDFINEPLETPLALSDQLLISSALSRAFQRVPAEAFGKPTPAEEAEWEGVRRLMQALKQD